MRKIAFCNQKGGVAKTTSALNIATYLALLGQKTLLVDLDPQANATSGLGVKKNEIKQSVYNVLHEHITLEESLLETNVDNLCISPSNINLTGAEIELVNLMGREYRLKKAIEVMEKPFDFIIFDCPPSLGLLTINGLTAADSVIIPIQCEYYALEGLSQLMNTLEIIKDNLNEELGIEGVLMTLADFRTNLTKEVISEVKEHFGDLVYETVIPRTIKLTEAPGFGKPIALYAEDSIGAKKYEAVAKEILHINLEEDADEEIEGDVSTDPVISNNEPTEGISEETTNDNVENTSSEDSKQEQQEVSPQEETPIENIKKETETEGAVEEDKQLAEHINEPSNMEEHNG